MGGRAGEMRRGLEEEGSDSFKIGRKRFNIAGFISPVAWPSAYRTRLGTMRMTIQVAIDWTTMLLSVCVCPPPPGGGGQRG